MSNFHHKLLMDCLHGLCLWTDLLR